MYTLECFYKLISPKACQCCFIALSSVILHLFFLRIISLWIIIQNYIDGNRNFIYNNDGLIILNFDQNSFSKALDIYWIYCSITDSGLHICIIIYYICNDVFASLVSGLYSLHGPFSHSIAPCLNDLMMKIKPAINCSTMMIH